MTLIEITAPDGRILRRCDQRCYNATTKRCKCLCAGSNHGIGLINAIQNSPHVCDKILADLPGFTGALSVEPVKLPFNQNQGG